MSVRSAHGALRRHLGAAGMRLRLYAGGAWGHMRATALRRRACAAALAICALGLGVVILDLALPLPDPLFRSPYSAVLEDRHGTLLGAHVAADGQWRFPPRATVPEKLARALVLAEDQRFHLHPGIDPLAIMRAFTSNVRAGHVVSGGSTLTQQVIRMARGNPARTYAEKLREMWLATALERRHTKAEILALYAAHAPFGGNVVGLEAAAWRHFGRPAGSLSWGEAALLAVLPRSPGQLHTSRNRDLLQARRDALLHRLEEANEIDAAELALALHEPIPERPQALPAAAPHLLATLSEGRDGARIETTLDSAVQQLAQSRTAQHAAALSERGIHNVAALVLDTRTLEVLAYVGNAPYDGDSLRGRAVDIVQSPRSTGSLLKPLLYAGMLQQGSLLPDMLVPDVPTQIAGYRPENYDRRYRGAVPARDALARSLNVPAVRLLRQFGVTRFHEMLSHLGMQTLFRQPEDYGLTLILGGAEGTLWDLAGVYAHLGRIAMQPEIGADLAVHGPRVLRAAPHADGSPRADTSEIGPGAAWLTLQALRSVERPASETGWQQLGGAPVAWKTGTSFGLRDAWAIGITPRWTVAVWAGNANGEGVPGLTGVDAAAPLLFAILGAGPRAGWFPRPDWDLREVEVCRDDGFLATSLCESRRVSIPRSSSPSNASPYHRRLFTDQTGAWQVHAGCESLDRMRVETRMVLPPSQERYYRSFHPEHRALPPLRPDCATSASAPAVGGTALTELELVYPEPGSRIYIPRDLAGERSRAVLVAVHRRPDAVVYWHLDDTYLGQTRELHRWPLLASPGPHRLVLVDDRGRSIERTIVVLGDAEPDSGTGTQAGNRTHARPGLPARAS